MPSDEAADRAAEAVIVPAIIGAQPDCSRHRVPCARCEAPASPRARMLAERGVSVCVCEAEACTCGVAAFLVAEGPTALAALALTLAVQDAFTRAARDSRRWPPPPLNASRLRSAASAPLPRRS